MDTDEVKMDEDGFKNENIEEDLNVLDRKVNTGSFNAKIASDEVEDNSKVHRPLKTNSFTRKVLLLHFLYNVFQSWWKFKSPFENTFRRKTLQMYKLYKVL